MSDIDYDRFDRLTKQKIGNIPGVLDWIPATTEKRNFRLYYIGAAACILAAIAAVWLSTRHSRPPQPPSDGLIEGTLSWRMISGDNPAANMSGYIVLAELKEDSVYKTGSIRIGRKKDQIYIIPEPDAAATNTDSLQYSFAVAGKKDIQVFSPQIRRTQLIPGTTMSFFHYPPGTKVKENRIVCDGQALFEIDPNYAIPTVVKTLKQEITVLGTIFGIRDYKTEDTSAVFCYNGKVSVKDLANHTATLKDSQRVTVQSSHELNVSTGDFPQAQWSSPEILFDFSKMDLDGAMTEIANWYGITKVTFEPGINRKTPGTVLTGKISRYLTLQQVFSILDRNDLHFSVQGKEIHVGGKHQ